MSRIKVLHEDLKNKIAAGEVVERPASVVKELLENSIDAGSTTIGVEVLYGGRKLIRVSDNGTGMDREDAFLSFERHTTSKLHSEDDLFNIRTMGFRGEALSSIASVSCLLLTTGDSTSGISIEVRGGKVSSIKDAPANGTCIEVRDLFFNTPVRKKFLKKDSTELMHIIEAVTRLALSHPETGFSITADGQETMNLPRASGLRERLAQVYGIEFLNGLLRLSHKAYGLEMEAFTSKPDNLRNTRVHQLVFVNRRPIKEPLISHALYSAYEGVIPRDKHPIYYIFMEVDPGRVDFNVHPTKREVRFQDKEAVYRFIKQGITEAVRTTIQDPARRAAVETAEDRPTAEPAGIAYVPASSGPPARSVLEALPLTYSRTDMPYIYLGDTFIALSEGGGLTLIDHHAAHERILYERLLKGINLASSQLLFPKQAKLSPREYMVILEHRNMLFEFGMDIDDFGHNTVMVRSLPGAMVEADLRAVLSDIAGQLLEGVRPGQSLKEAVAARIACHSSIRGKKILSPEGLSALLGDLQETEHPGQCPHGRPTRVFYSLDELKRIFKRK